MDVKDDSLSYFNSIVSEIILDSHSTFIFQKNKFKGTVDQQKYLTVALQTFIKLIGMHERYSFWKITKHKATTRL